MRKPSVIICYYAWVLMMSEGMIILYCILWSRRTGCVYAESANSRLPPFPPPPPSPPSPPTFSSPFPFSFYPNGPFPEPPLPMDCSHQNFRTESCGVDHGAQRWARSRVVLKSNLCLSSKVEQFRKHFQIHLEKGRSRNRRVRAWSDSGHTLGCGTRCGSPGMSAG